jgi:hypothetical protein
LLLFSKFLFFFQGKPGRGDVKHSSGLIGVNNSYYNRNSSFWQTPPERDPLIDNAPWLANDNNFGRSLGVTTFFEKSHFFFLLR